MRDFHQRQDIAKKQTRRLVLALGSAGFATILTTAVIVSATIAVLSIGYIKLYTGFEINDDFVREEALRRFLMVFAFTAVTVLGIGVYKSWQLMQGGGVALAQRLGGTRVWQDVDVAKQHAQLANVVEELTIVTGIARPKLFVLENERGINAFAAGIHPRDTVVAVTAGAIERLDRSQLQAVLAHEFSHIVNADVQVNLRSLGALHAILSIETAASYLRGVSQQHHGAAPLAKLFGFLLWPVGKLGGCFAALAKMAINRQREFLADAGAVQYTRNPEALISALRTIAADGCGGQLQTSEAAAAMHLFFFDGLPSSALFSSHPPVEERIRRLQGLPSSQISSGDESAPHGEIEHCASGS